METVLVLDSYTRRFIDMDINGLVEIIQNAESVRKAKHKKDFTVNEFLEMFGFPYCGVLHSVRIDKSYPISFYNHTLEDGRECYVLDYSVR